MGLMVDHSIASAVESMYTIARKISRRDPALAKKITACAKELNKHPGWIDEKYVEDMRKAGGL